MQSSRAKPRRIPFASCALAACLQLAVSSCTSSAPRQDAPDRIKGPDEAIEYVAQIDRVLRPALSQAHDGYTVSVSPDETSWIVVIDRGAGGFEYSAVGYAVDRSGAARRVNVATGSCAMQKVPWADEVLEADPEFWERFIRRRPVNSR